MKSAKTLLHLGHKQICTPDLESMGPGLGEPSKKWVANGIGPGGMGGFQQVKAAKSSISVEGTWSRVGEEARELTEGMRIEGATVCQEWREIQAPRTINPGRCVRARAQTPGVLGHPQRCGIGKLA